MALSDKLKQVGQEGTVTSLQAPGKALGASSINVGAVTNWPTTSGFVLAIRTVDPGLVSDDNPAGEVPGTYTEWSADNPGGGTTVTISPTPVAGSDQVYTAGANTQVFLPISAYRENKIVEWGLVQHNQDGTHGNITASSLTTSSNATVGGNLSVTGTLTGITPAKFSNPYKFSVYLNNAQSISASAVTKVAYDTKVFDTGSNVDIVTNKGRFTAPIAGFYQFNASVFVGPVTGGSVGGIVLNKNGTTVLGGNTLQNGANGAQLQFVLSGMLQLAANDYVEVFYYNGDNVSRNVNVGQPYSFFQGFLISTT